MKKTFLFFVFVLNCVFVRAQTVSDYFSVDSATQQGWAAGVEEGGSGINYCVHLTMKKNETIEFDSIWIGTYALKLFLITSNDVFKKGTSFWINAAQFFPYKIIYDEPSLPVKVPMMHEGIALISYKVNGKIYYSEVATIKQLEFLAYP